ncbi:MAG: transaldolase family protein [Spirochaetales bacterium]
MEGYFKRVQRETASRFWINNVTRKEAALAIDAGAVGCTQNPSYVWKMLTSEDDREFAEAKLARILATTDNDNTALEILQRELVGNIAALFRPMYEASGGELGYVSIQGDPFDESRDTILRLARENRKMGPNIMIKIPVTEGGLEAVGECIREGMPVNATEVMSLRQAMDLCDIYDEATEGMAHPPKVYLSHIAGIFDEYLAGAMAAGKIGISSDHLYQAGKIVAKKIRSYMDNRDTRVGFINGGARGLHHFTEWVGANISTTINWKGTAEDLLRLDPPVVCRFDAPVPEAVVDSLVSKVPDFARAYWPEGLEPHEFEEFGPVVLFCSSFRKAWKSSLARIAEIRKA